MRIHTYLDFDGDCREAFDFYVQTLNGKPQDLLTWGDAPFASDLPESALNKIMHASIMIGDHIIMGTDSVNSEYKGVSGTNVVLSVEDPDEAERLFKRLAQGGEITMPMEETFWARRFGMLKDRFGVPWMVNCDKVEPDK